MTDVAPALGLTVEADGVVRATTALDKFVDKSDAAGASADRQSASHSKTALAIQQLVRQLDKITGILQSVDSGMSRAAAASEATARANEHLGRAAQTATTAIAQEAAASAQATRATAELSTTTQRLTINFTQSAAAAQNFTTATQSANATMAQQASAATVAANGVKQLDAHIQAYQAHLAALARFNAPFDAHVRAFREASQQAGAMGAATAKAAETSSQMRAAGQQLAFQLGDISQGFAMGTKASTIFAQQSGQVIQAVSLMAGGTGKLASFMGGPWGIAITAATLVLVPFIGKLFETANAADTARGALAELQKQQREQEQENNRLILSQQEIQSLYNKRAALARTVAQAEAILARTGPDTARQNGINRLKGQIDALTFQINSAEVDLKAAQSAAAKGAEADAGNMAGMIADRAKLAAATTAAERAQAQFNIQIREAQQAWDASNKGAEAQSALLEARTRAERGLSAAQAASAAALKEQNAAEAEARRLAREAQQAMEQRIKTAQDYADSLQDQAAKFGKSALEIQRMEVAAKAAAAPTAELAHAIRDAGRALEQKQLDQVATAFDKMITGLYDELELSRLVGRERELRVLSLEKEGKMAEWAAQGFTDLVNRWASYAAARMAGINERSTLARDAKEAEKLADELERVNRQLDDMVGVLQGMGGLAGTLGGILSGLQSGNFAGLGPLGGLLNIAIQGPKDYDKQADLIADRISDVFGVSGPFAKTLANALQGASTGAMAGSIIGNSQGNQIGGMVGGAIGQGIGGSIAALGSFGGPIGAVVGGILGSVIGGLFKKTPTGSAILGQGGVIGTSGNGGRDASGLGSSVVTSLDQIAKALGATVGNYSVSIGMRGDDYKVDPTGRGRTKESDVLSFGKDAQAAVMAAVADAIKDGALQGLADWMKTLINAGGDLDSQLNKIVSLKSAYDELEQKVDPAGYAIRQVNDRFDALRAVLDEAGSSAEDRAKIEQLYALELAEASKQVSKASEEAEKRRELEIALMTASGDVLGALAAARADEVAALPESLRAIQEQIYAAELLTQKRGLEIQLMDALGDKAGAVAAQRQIELAALDASLRPIQEQIYAAQDLAAARQVEAEEAARLAKIAQDRASLEIGVLEAMGDASAALAAKRTLELAAMEESLRPFQETIYAWEDLASARAAEASAAAAAASLAATRRDLEITLMEATGNAQGALNARRQLEIAALDATLQPLQMAIYSAQDAAEAQDRLATAQRNAAEAAREQQAAMNATVGTIFDIQTQIMELSGAAGQAQAKEFARQRQLAAAAPEVKPWLEMLYDLQDAAETARTQEERAAKFTKERRDLQIELMQLQGKGEEALLALRYQQLAALDPSNRALQQQVWDLQDAAEAAKIAADAERALADQRQGLEQQLAELTGNEAMLAQIRAQQLAALPESLRGLQQQVWAAQKAQEANAKAANVARQRADLEYQLAVLQGDATQALATRREHELLALDGSLHGIQRQIWALEDAKAAEEARTQAIADARGVLADSYNRESGALKDTIEKFGAFGKELREFKAGLSGAVDVAAQYRRAQALFVDTSSAARLGDADALGKLSGVAKDFLDVSKSQATSALDYQRDVARVQRALGAAIGAADSAVDYARAQLTALDKLVEGIDLGNETAISTLEALNRLNLLLGGTAAPAATSFVPQAAMSVTVSGGDSANGDEVALLRSEIADLRAELQAIAKSTAKAAQVLDRFGGGVDAGIPLPLDMTA